MSNFTGATVTDQPTLIGTSDPVNLAQGLPLFPDLGVARVGAAMNGDFFDYHKHGLGADLHVKAGYSLNFGLVGPAWATRMTVQAVSGQSSDHGYALDMKISDDSTQAGLALGASAGLTLELKAQVFHHGLDIYLTPTVDLIEIAIYVLTQFLPATNLLRKIDNVVPSALSSWGALDVGESFLDGQGSTNPSPTFTVPFNLWSLMVEVDEASATFAGLVVAADKILNKAKSSVVLGPTIGLGITSSITIEGIQLDDFSFPVLGFDSNDGAVYAELESPVGSTRSCGLNFRQVPTLDLELGFEASVSIFQVINLGVNYSFDVLGLLGITIELGTYHDTLTNASGSASLQPSAAFYEVELA